MKKYRVTQEFMNGLYKFVNEFEGGVFYIENLSLNRFPQLVKDWVFESNSVLEIIKRLDAIIDWTNGEAVFEVGTPKYVVQRKDAVLSGVHQYINLEQSGNVRLIYGLENATRFDDFEVAQEWTNKHFEVVEVDE